MSAILWQAEYAHDRRAHRHRCRVCNRVINAGELVWMARVADKTTKAIHEECSEKASIGGLTALGLLAAHAYAFRNPHWSERRVHCTAGLAIAIARISGGGVG